MAFVALYDANVLYLSTLRDLLIRIAQEGLVQAKWTDRILDETFSNLKAKRPDLDPARLDRTRTVMTRAVRDCMVKGYEPLIAALELPDPDDRHVLAAAIRAKAQIIVTFNLKDFPDDGLSPWDVEAKHPDAFIEDQIGLDPATVYALVCQIADSWKKPPGTVQDVLAPLERDGMVASVAALRAL
ncbi:PIN domain-containing protein [Streptomyces carminius]|uniref:PIN domain-containing protein n=1 Tax=Streptomyces carminius TaxID=2665496 RepID=A0A2M8M220_9ACTN|nr:PIN domain-containing protein [Streptomyces carminius]PJE98240.1 PIN domain-containing protein [Streptomyces carminius]